MSKASTPTPAVTSSLDDDALAAARERESRLRSAGEAGQALVRRRNAVADLWDRLDDRDYTALRLAEDSGEGHPLRGGFVTKLMHLGAAIREQGFAGGVGSAVPSAPRGWRIAVELLRHAIRNNADAARDLLDKWVRLPEGQEAVCFLKFSIRSAFLDGQPLEDPPAEMYTTFDPPPAAPAPLPELKQQPEAAKLPADRANHIPPPPPEGRVVDAGIGTSHEGPLSAPDGPFGADIFRFAGVEVPFGKAATRRRLVVAMWDAKRNRLAEPRGLQAVIDAVYGRGSETTDEAFRKLCSETTQLLAKHGCPLAIRILQGKVYARAV